MLYGALELGGSKTICAVGNENGQILGQEVLETSTPEETMPKIIEFFKSKLEDPEADEKLSALGVASFGPVDVRENSKTYGNILNTPKIAWRNFPLVTALKEALNIPVGFDTDTNGALLGEVTWGTAKGLSDAVYIKVGIGIGMGAMCGGSLIHGMLHPEAGHIKLVPVPGDEYAGNCPNHGQCFEGMACGPALRGRWGKLAKELREMPEVWELEAKYIAQAMTSIIYILSPQKIILGGGVMNHAELFPMVRKYVLEYINGYIETKELLNINSYITPASLNGNEGVVGALKLADMAAAE